MSETPDTQDLKRRLRREIDHVKTVMLGLVGGPAHHFQPMTAFSEDDDDTVWFYTRKDNDLIRDAAAGHAAMFNLLTRDHGFIACVGGWLSQDHDRERISHFWNPVVAAWFPEGENDPNLTLLRFDPMDADVWVSQGNVIRFGYEVVKANLTKTLPDVGEKAHLNL